MKHELTGRRPSKLSAIYRRHSLAANEGGTGRLLDWTRHVDGDWRWYCSYCSALVILQEEKDESAAQFGWSATRRAATGHRDEPWAMLIVTHADGAFTVTSARSSNEAGHQSLGPMPLSEDELIRWIERAFEQHYTKAGHPDNLVPKQQRVA